RRMWDKDKPMATVVMLNPCHADNIITDTTTALVVNNVARLEKYGGVNIVNLYSLLTNKLNFRWNSDEDLNDPENDTYIKKAAEESEAVILAWGKGADSNQRITERAVVVINLLNHLEDKLYIISDGLRKGLHPLTPTIRNGWTLEPAKLRKEITEKEKNEEENASEFVVVGENSENTEDDISKEASENDEE
ncbi:MAG: DUF1643 domain-containing protein, partial [Ruminococcus sp.]|nr:DUF1643 domain-containing protein [Ruminococcus sp.]